MSQLIEAASKKGLLSASKRKLLPKPSADPSERGKIVLGLLLPVSVLVLWQIFGDLGYISPLLFPTPAVIAGAFVNLAVSGDLWTHIGVSGVRVLQGFLLGGGLGLLFGMLVGFFQRVEKWLDPSVQMIRMIPSLATVPLFILWFGIGEESKVLLIAKSAFFPLYINTFLGIRGVDQKLFDVTRVLGFSRVKQIALLIVPGSLPHILLGIRLSLGLSWLGLVVAELIASTSGIGYLMSDARQFGDTPVVFVGIILFALLGLLTDGTVRLIEKRLLQWQDTYKG